jgi:Aminoglycoside adenylyltransferase, C-terminal domain/Nucleotidyltransferase domain
VAANSVISSTPFPDVNRFLGIFLAEVRAVLGQRFVGLYLYGSLAGGDFVPARSDIDFVVVTDGELPAGAVSALGSMHARLWAGGSKWALKLEGTYIPKTALRRYHPEAGPFPCVNEGQYYLARHESDWVLQRHILRESGVVVAGPDIHPLIDPVSPEEIHLAVRGYLGEWWRPMLQNPERLHNRSYQAYATLSMCRVLYTLRYGRLASKTESARWAQRTLGECWASLIGRALAWPEGDQADEMAETLEFIHYVVYDTIFEENNDHKQPG